MLPWRRGTGVGSWMFDRCKRQIYAIFGVDQEAVYGWIGCELEEQILNCGQDNQLSRCGNKSESELKRSSIFYCFKFYVVESN